MGRSGTSTVRLLLLGSSFLCVLLVSTSEPASESDDGIAPPLSCVPCVLASAILLGDKLIAALTAVFLRCPSQYLRFLRSREPSTRTLCPSSRTGTPRTRIPAPGPV